MYISLLESVSVPLSLCICVPAREILLDILPTLSRPDLVEVIHTLVSRDLISRPRAAIMINMMVLTVKPSPRTFDSLIVRKLFMTLLLNNGYEMNHFVNKCTYDLILSLD